MKLRLTAHISPLWRTGTEHTIDSVKEFAKKKKGKCLGFQDADGTFRSFDNLPGNTHLPVKTNKIYQKYRWQCADSKHDPFVATLNNVVSAKKGSWCPACARNVNNQLGRLREIVKEREGELLSLKDEPNEFNIPTSARVTIRCKESHQWTTLVNNIINQGNWCSLCNVNGLYTVMGTKSEKLIWDKHIKKNDNCTYYNVRLTGCDFFRYENKTLTFFEIKTQFLKDGSESEPKPVFKSLKRSQRELRKIINIINGLSLNLDKEAYKETFMSRVTTNSELTRLKTDLGTSSAKLKKEFKDCESLQYCVIFCGFYINSLEPQLNCEIIFPGVGYFGKGTTASDTGFGEKVITVPPDEAKEILTAMRKIDAEGNTTDEPLSQEIIPDEPLSQEITQQPIVVNKLRLTKRV